MGGKLRLLIVLGLLAHALAFQGARALWEPDEGRYSAVAMEMLRLDDWIQPHLHRDHPHWTKPPVTYWAIAASVGGLGRHEFAVRLPSALAFAATTLLVFRLGKVMLRERAWMAPLVHASFLMTSAASNTVTTDGLLTMWETAAVCAFALSLWDGRVDGDRALLWMWAALGLAFLTKGPPGLLPLLPIVVFRRLAPQALRARPLRWWAGLGILLAINAPWYGLVVARNPDLARYFLVDETYERIFTGAHGRNPEWFGALRMYAPVLLLGTLPWTWVLARSAWRGVRAWAAGARRAPEARDAQGLFLALWVACPVLVFLLVPSRLALYLLPTFAPLALVAARGLEQAAFRWSPARRWLLAAWLAALVALRLGAATISDNRDARAISDVVVREADAPFAEIAFYDTRALWGLNFYLDMEVEEVAGSFLPDELLEVPDRLWIMRPGDVAAFLAEAGRQGAPFRLVGHIHDWYDICQPIPDDAPGDDRAGRDRGPDPAAQPR